MIDFVRVGVRVAAVASIIGIAVGVYALFSAVEIPSVSTQLLVQGYSKGLAIINHWAPEFMWIIKAVIALFFVKWSVFMLRYTVIGIKWLLVIWR